MFYLFFIVLIAAVCEYFYFNMKLNTQRTNILVLTKQNESLRSKVSKQPTTLSTVNISYSAPTYYNGYTIENCFVFLSPLENSPTVYQCMKSLKASVLDCAEILNSTWYFISIASTNNSFIKGWVKESDIKFMVDESAIN